MRTQLIGAVAFVGLVNAFIPTTFKPQARATLMVSGGVLTISLPCTRNATWNAYI